MGGTGQRSRIGEASGAVGALAARRPCGVIWGMVLLSFVLIMGISNMKVQTNGLYLWVPTKSEPYKNMVDMIDRFGEFRRSQIIILYPRTGHNILTEEHLGGVLAVHEAIVSGVESDEKGVRFNDICFTYGSGDDRQCNFWKPLAMFG